MNETRSKAEATRGWWTGALRSSLLLLTFGVWVACGDVVTVGDNCVVDADCLSAQACVDGFCVEVAPQDVESDQSADVHVGDAPDVTPPTLDAEESDLPLVDTELEIDTHIDDTFDAIEDEDVDVDVDADVEAEVEGDADAGDVQLDDVIDDLIVSDVSDTLSEDIALDAAEDVAVDVPPAGPAELGEACEANCVAGTLCKEQSDGVKRCVFFPGGVCASCKQDVDCQGEGAKCLIYPGGSSFCGLACQSNANCSDGFLCVAGQCKPQVGFCECKANILGWSLPCTNSSPLGFCEGSLVCLADGWDSCSAVYPSLEKCDGIDNNCNGETDEGILLYEKGEWLNIGAACGQGQCGEGEVVCGPDGTALCSSAFKAVPEQCDDVVDNDCDGYVNEECDVPDIDGDGFLNENDCRPMDAGYYPDAPEACCASGIPGDPDCDTNCDGSTTPCEACDLDSDGYCPPDDCDDFDPSTYPGAPEKCDDGVDQDCKNGDLFCPPFQDQDLDGYIPPADCGEGNAAIFPGAPELCDNQDNDCDGLTDEGDPGGGDLCGQGEDFCTSGVTACSHTPFAALIQCIGATPFGVELCDGKDNDCNGLADDPWPSLGQACDGADLDQCAHGEVVCSGDGLGVVCSPEGLENLAETCNGLDDDCDGATDEFVCPIDDVDGDGVTPEDGDCDDFRSEVFPGATEPCCDPALGAAGALICDLNCDEIVLPCALNDKDADGFTPDEGDCDDDAPTVYPGAPELCGDGIDQDCTVGDLDCSLVPDGDGDGYHVGVDCNDADPTIHPWALETCNFVDDDCDGIVDDGNPAGKEGPCGTNNPGCTAGQWVCLHDLATYTTLVTCANDKFQAPELCNGLDDDCDGEIDEIFFALGESCDGPDADACAYGTYQCTSDGVGVECGVEDPEGLVELCDGIDNDCDEAVDEDLNYDGISLNAPCEGVGACGSGVVVCVESGEVVCSTNPNGPFPQVSEELCNGQDDDCDGETDEGFTWFGIDLGGACSGFGSCGAGVVECGSQGLPTCSTLSDGSDSQALEETCNLVDDDCDGLVDEELGIEASPCQAVGVCAESQVVALCAEGEWSCDYGATQGYQEEETLCDGLDNDCDGTTDDGMQVGEVCDGPDSDSCATGTWTCTAEGLGVVCLDEIITDIPEVCNGFDDDCDGLVDEVDIEPAAAGCNIAGVCSLTWAVTIYCGQGENVCDYSLVPFYQEEETLCDGLDNDCDGLVDEGLTYDGQPLGTLCEGKGQCGTGIVQCSVGTKTAICSTEAGGFGDQSAQELCNGLDDDCDGSTDEDFVWQGAAVGSVCTPGGSCSPGVVECSADTKESTCSTALGGSEDMTTPEECDGIDNDCDGEVDELVDLDLAEADCLAQGVCTDLALFVLCEQGAWACAYDQLPSFEADEALCDGLDNDCDGAVDEAFSLIGTPCDGEDEGVCPTGTWTCSDDAQALVCINETGVGVPEVCDGVDNDCDGLVDEGQSYKGVPLGFLCDGMGPCGVGFVECAPDGTTTCSTHFGASQSQAAPESCNGIDDDCNGLVDDGLVWQEIPLGQACDGTGACGLGVVECQLDTGVPICSADPGGSNPQPVAEICNGLDDDCDGEVDEGVLDLGARCDGPDADLCETGVTTCADGAILCVSDVACVEATECFDPGDPLPQMCLCVGQACSVSMGDTCSAEGCSCNGDAPCFLPSVCVPGTGCEVPDQ